MKYLSYLLALFMLACNNEEGSTANNIAPSKEKQLTDAVKQFSDSVIMVENLAQFYRENGDYEKALSAINNAIKKDSTKTKYWHMKAVLHYENEDTTQAIAALEKSILLSKDLNDILLLAKIYAETKNPDALALCEILVKQNKFVKEAVFIKGTYFKNINDAAKAIIYFDEAISMSYTFMEPYGEKAKILYGRQKYMDALIVLDKAVKIQNNYPEGYFFMGRCFEKLNRWEDAKESYETALIYDKDYEEAKEALAKLGPVDKK